MTQQQREPIKVVMDIIKGYMNLDDNHCYIYNQKWLMPEDDSLFVVLSITSSEVVGNPLKYRRTEESLISINPIIVTETHSINIFSKSNEARLRQPEIIASFNSDLATRLQEQHRFQFGFVPVRFIDVSSVEASARLNRFVADYKIIYGRTYERESPFWNSIDFKFYANN